MPTNSAAGDDARSLRPTVKRISHADVDTASARVVFDLRPEGLEVYGRPFDSGAGYDDLICQTAEEVLEDLSHSRLHLPPELLEVYLEQSGPDLEVTYDEVRDVIAGAMRLTVRTGEPRTEFSSNKLLKVTCRRVAAAVGPESRYSYGPAVYPSDEVTAPDRAFTEGLDRTAASPESAVGDARMPEQKSTSEVECGNLSTTSIPHLATEPIAHRQEREIAYELRSILEWLDRIEDHLGLPRSAPARATDLAERLRIVHERLSRIEAAQASRIRIETRLEMERAALGELLERQRQQADKLETIIEHGRATAVESGGRNTAENVRTSRVGLPPQELVVSEATDGGEGTDEASRLRIQELVGSTERGNGEPNVRMPAESPAAPVASAASGPAQGHEIVPEGSVFAPEVSALPEKRRTSHQPPTKQEIVAWRKERDLTQQQAADLTGVSLSTWRNWESGRSSPSAAATRLIRQSFQSR